jgi:hypothetical protein
MPGYYPIIYVRGFAFTDSEIDETSDDPTNGFNLGATHARQGRGERVLKFRFPGPFVRLMTEHVYADSIAGETDSVEFSYWNCHYWLDLGNNADSGQFVLGQPENQRNKGRDLRLPTAPELFPELIIAKLDKKDKLPPCSALEALERQEPFVNQTLAYQALAMLARLFRYGRLSYHGGFVNLRTGRTTSLAVDPVLWQRMRTQPADSELPRRKRRKVVRQ